MTPDRISLRIRRILQNFGCATCKAPLEYAKGPTPEESGPVRYTVLNDGSLVCAHGCGTKAEAA